MGTIVDIDGVRIIEKSVLARLAAIMLRTNNMALTVGRSIYLYNATRTAFLRDEAWVRHELKHVQQFEEHGFILFVVKYYWETIRKGYRNNKYEREARAAEKLPGYTVKHV